MSQRRRRRDREGTLLNLQRSSAQETADAIYRDPRLPPDITSLDAQRKTARPVDIGSIWPDRSQPRRAVPMRARRHWDGDPRHLAQLFNSWLAELRRDGVALDLEDLLRQRYWPEGLDDTQDESGESRAWPEEAGPLASALLGLVRLAVNIRQTGLTNPITVARAERAFQLETGERRWLAFHLLQMHFPDENWSHIPAHLVERVDVWRQAGENSARRDLNAIGRARQLAILLMDLLRERGHNFREFDEVLAAGGSERDYYAQVADGQEFRIPRGEGERLLNAMALNSPTQLRQYRALLRLDDERWRDADERNLGEGEIRRLKPPSRSRPAPPQRGLEGNPFTDPANRRRRQRIWGYARRYAVLGDDERLQALEQIDLDRRWLEELRSAIRRRG
ncbi:MAG: ParB N-terminal domain-containing protein [Anaerolineaceae bacterium]|nr:ParB N-terminal domain-containing protein [Anaerolineaceae bacterium]